MTTLEVIAQAARSGVTLCLDTQGQVRARPGLDGLAPAFQAELRTHRAELRDYLRTESEWRAAIAEVAAAYHTATEPGWLDDSKLLDAVGDAMRSGDRERVMAAIGRWRRAWMQLLTPGEPLDTAENVGDD